MMLCEDVLTCKGEPGLMRHRSHVVQGPNDPPSKTQSTEIGDSQHPPAASTPLNQAASAVAAMMNQLPAALDGTVRLDPARCVVDIVLPCVLFGLAFAERAIPCGLSRGISRKLPPYANFETLRTPKNACPHRPKDDEPILQSHCKGQARSLVISCSYHIIF